jgi:hypothetical protein
MEVFSNGWARSMNWSGRALIVLIIACGVAHRAHR